MKTTRYFEYTRQRMDRRCIKDEWIIEAIKNPVRQDVQKDGRIRKWFYINDEDKYLRVVLLEDGITVHNAFFDRSFKETKQ